MENLRDTASFLNEGERGGTESSARRYWWSDHWPLWRIQMSPQLDPQSATNSLADSGNSPDVLARTTYQELRDGGLSDTDIIAFAGELLSLIATNVSSQAAAE